MSISTRLTAVIAALFLTACFSGSSRDLPSRNVPDGLTTLCGSPAIVGKRLSAIDHPTNPSCGFGDAVELYSVAGVQMKGNTRLNCTTAKAVEKWVTGTAKPAVSRATGENLASLDTWSAYRCSNRPGGRISEHAKGNAIDFGGLTTTGGTYISVLRDWGGTHGRLLERLKSGACGPFGVVLHPGNDAAHKDHFHFDISHRTGPWVYCRNNP